MAHYQAGEINGKEAFSAKGYTGQSVTVIPELDLIVTTTTNWKYIVVNSGDPTAKFINDYISEYITPAVNE
ncbi:MAG: hypothetical protein FH748_02865 [Balneolaceae bacterium]|nr:hypothetical protein [Balneolaceae bacterium]